MDLPEIRQWEVLSPEGPPTIDGASVYPKSLESSRTRLGEGPCLMAVTKMTTAAEVDFSPEEAYGWGRDPFTAAVALAAEAEPKAVGRRQIIGSPGSLG